MTNSDTHFAGDAMSGPTAANAPIPKRRRFRIIRFLSILAILLAVLIVAAPWIVAHTGLRDRAINAILASPSVTASSDGASFGWFSPLAVDGLHLRSMNNHVDVRVQGIAADRSLWRLWSSAPDLGTITVEKPYVTLELPLDVQIQREGRQFEPTFAALVKDAALTVRFTGQDEPVLEVDDVNLALRLEKADEGRVLTVDPVTIFDKRKLSPKLASKLLHLFDPTMEGAPQISGAVSLSVDKMRIPVGVSKDQTIKGMEVEGKVVLHEVATEISTPMRQALARLVAAIHLKEPTSVVRLTENDEIRFQVRDGRLYHEGLRIGVPDIDPKLQVTSRGSVGLDKTLDLSIDVPRLEDTPGKTKGAAKCRITGTIASPKITVENGALVLHQHDQKEPMIAADGINLSMQVESTPAGHVLAVAPVEVFKNTKLNLGVAAGLVKFLDPDIQSDRQVTGEISLSFSKLRLPLTLDKDQAIKQLEVEGKVKLHQVASEIKSPMWQSLIRLLADMNGKEPPKVMHLIEESEIQFQVRDGRLYHEGQRIGFPEIDPKLMISSRGSIGLDQTLDLFVELPRLDEALRKAKGPAKCHITGTIANPKIAVENGSLVLREHDRKEPILAVDGINMAMQVESTPSGHVLVVEPVEVFKKTKLNLGVASSLVKFLAPDVQSDREVSGEISLSLSKLRVPLTTARDQAVKQFEAEGKVKLHHVSAEIKSPMWQGLIRMVADLYGKQPPKVMHLIEESEIGFQVREGRLHHHGQRIGFPEIDPDLVIGSRGSIGVDETLDLFVDLPRLPRGKRDKGLECRISGTIRQPKIAIPNATLVVPLTEGKKPALTVDNINLNFSVETSPTGRMLTLAPVTIFEKQKLTPELGDELLHLVAPTLADLAGVQGDISLSLDSFGVPLDAPKGEFVKRVRLSGKLKMNQIIVTVKTPILQAMVKVLADMHGKKASDVVRVVQNSEVRFQVRDGRMYHEGLRLGFPDLGQDLVISSSGSVGVDKSLDFVLDVPPVLLNRKDPVRLRVTGTMDNPVVTEIKKG
jgi:hypothetical protein